MIFGNNSTDKSEFHKRKHLIEINKVDINKIVISNKGACGKEGAFENFNGYIASEGNNKSLCIKLPQLSRYAKYFDKDKKCINFMVNDKKLLKKHNKILDKVSNLLKKEFDCEPVYNDKYIKSKMQFCIMAKQI